jgi:hypothetical protein
MRSSKSSSRSVRCGGPWASGGARQRKQHRGDVQLVGGTTVHPFPTADGVAATLEDFASGHPGRFPPCVVSHAHHRRESALDSVLPMNSIVIGLHAEVVIILISGASGLARGSKLCRIRSAADTAGSLLSPGKSSCVDETFAPLTPGSCRAITTAVDVPAPYG